MASKRFPTIAGRLAAYGQGATMGYGDELGAQGQEDLESLTSGSPKAGTLIRAGLSALTPAGPILGMMGTEGDPEALKYNRTEIADERKAEPKVATALEVMGSLPTAAALGGGGAARTAAQDLGIAARTAGGSLGQRLMGGVAHAAKEALVPGAVYGSGQGESPLGRLAGGAGGAALAAGGAGLLRGGANAAMEIPALKSLVAEIARRTLQKRIEAMPAEPIVEADYVGDPSVFWRGGAPKPPAGPPAGPTVNLRKRPTWMGPQ